MTPRPFRRLFIQEKESGGREYICDVRSYKSIALGLVEVGLDYTVLAAEDTSTDIIIVISNNDRIRFWDIMRDNRISGTMFL